MTKIQFKDLSAWLKLAVIVSWITCVIYGLYFLLGFVEGLAV